MNGKIVALIVVICAALAGGAIYYLQVYGYYYAVAAAGPLDVQLVRRDSETPEPIAHDGFSAIDADSSPIRYRACFTTPLDPAALAETHITRTGGEPRVAPGWFDCFDAEAIGAAIEAGTLTVFLGHKNIAYGVDRVVAIGADGRGWAWHELNDCGHKAYDGTVVGEECPPRPETR